MCDYTWLDTLVEAPMEEWKPNPYAQPFVPRRYNGSKNVAGVYVRQLSKRRIFTKLFQVSCC